jgi:hypothetical protein
MSGAGPNAEGNYTGKLPTRGTYVGDDGMHSDAHSQTAKMVGLGRWEVSFLPGRILTRSQATTAMVAADVMAARGTVLDDLDETYRLALAHWAIELDMLLTQLLTAWDYANAPL